MTDRREFVTRLAGLAGAFTLDADELKALTTATGSEWDTSWIDKLASAQFRVVFNASDIADGAAMNYAGTFLDHYHEVHGTSDAQTRPVIVFRRLGTVMAFNDVLWERYPIGEERKVTDPTTHAPATKNIFRNEIEPLQQRGLIALVCNVSLASSSYRIAEQTKRTRDEVLAEIRANLIPGAIVVPSGIYALIRAQNAGCAYMQGT
jgi:intracellular sulfur oxidation DsrE/DsrF family protein